MHKVSGDVIITDAHVQICTMVVSSSDEVVVMYLLVDRDFRECCCCNSMPLFLNALIFVTVLVIKALVNIVDDDENVKIIAIMNVDDKRNMKKVL